MDLSSLQPRVGSRHRVKRLGCGESSGHGKTSGKGHKGQKARSGGSIRLGFEGGQMPLARKIPKRGFNNAAFRAHVAVVNVGQIDQHFSSGEIVDLASLVDKGLVRSGVRSVKVLGVGSLTKALSFRVDALSSSARARVIEAGGAII